MVQPHIEYRGPGYPDLDLTTAFASPRELDSRVTDGLQVRLFWHPDDGHVSVVVEDTRSGEIFDLPVGDGDRALDVFHHPYAYAAVRRFRDNVTDDARVRVHASHGRNPR